MCCEVSPDGRLLAYSVDHDGSEVYRLLFRDLATGEDLPDVVEGTYYGLGWAADSGSVLYTTVDAAYRPDTVHRHVLGTGADRDEVVWHEPDRRFELDVAPTRSGAYVRLVAASRDTTEVRLVDTSRPGEPPVVVEPRRPGREYHVDHQPGPAGGRLLVVVDDEGPEFRLVTAPVTTPGRDHWREVVGHREDTRVVAADAFGDHVVVTERHGGRRRLRVLDPAGTTLRVLEPAGAGESVALGRTDEVDVSAFRVVREGWVPPPDPPRPRPRQSARRPWSTCRPSSEAAAPTTTSARSRRSQPTTAPGCRSRWSPVAAPPQSGPRCSTATAPTRRPRTLSSGPSSSPLLDRGVAFGVAHVRGGGERGRSWWQQGRLLHKRNTFTDFVACARHLVASGRTEPNRLAARGLSAGGLLMGATTHLAPEMFAVVVAEVPFVDVVNTMLDDTLPLTVGEWEEWGDPRDATAYEYLRSYSPYENLPGPRRPAVLVTASRHDPRVSVHEPAKWVAAMRADEAALPAGQRPRPPLLLRTLLGGGAHTGPAGRYDAWAHEALILSVVLDRLGATGDAPSAAGDGQLGGGVDRSPDAVVEPAFGEHDAAR